MLSFLEHTMLLEEDEQGLDNDAKGKMHEVLVAAHLKSPDHEGPHSKKKMTFPEHFRTDSDEDKEGKPRKQGESPEELHNRLRSRLTPEQYHHHYHKAKAAAQAILDEEKRRAKKQKRKPRTVSNVHWTSNPKDIERLTGKKGAKNPSDLVVTWSDGKREGKSMKVGRKSAAPTLSNPGKKQLHRLAHADLPENHPDREPEDKPGDKRKSTWEREASASRSRAIRRIVEKHGKKHNLQIDEKGVVTYSGKHPKAGQKVSANDLRKVEKMYPDTQRENRNDAAESCAKIADRLHRHFKRQEKKGHLHHTLRKLAQSEIDSSGMKVDRVQTSGEHGKFSTKIVNPHEELESTLEEHGPHLTVHRTNNTIHFKGKGGVTLASLQIKPKGSGGLTAIGGALTGIKGKAKVAK